VAIGLVANGGYFRLNYHRLLMIISGTILLMFINGYLLMAIACYSIGGYIWLL